MWLLITIACVTVLPPAGDDKDTDESDPPAAETDEDTDGVWESGLAATRPLIQFTSWPETAEQGLPELIAGTITSPAFSPSQLTLAWASSIDGPLTPPTVDPSTGAFSWSVSGLSPGWHELTLTAVDPDAQVGSSTLDVGICRWPERIDFSVDPVGTGWTILGDAYWESSGWLEITGNDYNKAGAIFLTDRKVNPGDFRMDFSIATGGGFGTGADGFAVSIIDTPDPTSLATLLDAAAAGGCLGYGTAPPCAATPINAFHVEFDTWYNVGTPVTDPTSSNHVAVTLDGDASDHLLWAAVPSLEDLAWRDVIVTVQGTHITVTMNGSTVIDGTIPDFTFDGGFIGVTGSTGAETNWHRFDNLQVRDRCTVPN